MTKTLTLELHEEVVDTILNAMTEWTYNIPTVQAFKDAATFAKIDSLDKEHQRLLLQAQTIRKMLDLPQMELDGETVLAMRILQQRLLKDAGEVEFVLNDLHAGQKLVENAVAL